MNSDIDTIADVDASGHWLGRTVTQISKAGRFWEDPAEDQDYFLRFPGYPEGSKPPFPRGRRSCRPRDRRLARSK